MLTLIEGGFFSGCHDTVVKRIQEFTKCGKKVILIVPEQQTVIAEREMADILPASAPLSFEATNFTRFANTVFRSLGGLAKPSADSSKRSLIMWRTLCELAPILETGNYSANITASHVSRMLSAAKAMQSAAVSPEELSDAAKKLSESEGALADARLPAKLRDLAAVMTLYKKILCESFADSDDDLFRAAQKINTTPSYLADTQFFIDGFTSFTEPQNSIIRELIARTDVSITLTLPKANPDAYEYSETRKTHRRLVKFASELSVDVALEKLGGRQPDADPLISETAELLWRTNVKVDEEFSGMGTVKIFEAENPYEECDFVAADIKRRVMDGARYSEFGIIARNLSAYHGIIDVAFEKANVPLFISAATDISSYEVIKLIYSALSIIVGGYRRRDVISYSKCSLCGVPRALADEFEIYTEKWQIDGARFKDGMTWNMNPSGYSERRGEREEEILLAVDRAKLGIISPIESLEAALESSSTVKEYAEGLVDFLVSLDIEAKLSEKSRDIGLILGSDAAADTERLWQLICDALDGLCEVTGELKCTPETFLTLLKITFSEISIGKIPSFSEQVDAANADTARLQNKKYVYIIGANAGQFPLSVDDDSYFSDNDKRTLGSFGLSLEADTDIRRAGELYYFVRAISFAKRELVITYHATDEAFAPSMPSDAVIRIRECSEGKILPVKLSDLSVKERAWTLDYALEHLSKNDSEYKSLRDAISACGQENKLKIIDQNIINSKLKLSNSAISMIYGSTIRMSQSKLERYVKCPMNYFCTYNLGLSAQERVEFDARNIGNFIHAILENFFRNLKERGIAIADISEEEKLELIRKVADGYISACFEGIPKTSTRIKSTVNKLCVMAKPIIDSLCEEFAGSEYEPIFFELDIDKNKEGCPTPTLFKAENGAEIYVAGKIDRVDVYHGEKDTYVRVIDYKSGSKLFSPSDIEQGLNLQMFLYLKSVCETEDEKFKKRVGLSDGGELIPAGVIYVKTDVSSPTIEHDSQTSAHTAVKSNQTRMGMILDDPESISAQNPDFLPIKFKKDGTPDSRSLSRIYTRSGWDNISATIDKAVTDICNKMLSGAIDATPFSKKSDISPCRRCDFKAICRNSKI